ncbi:MAG: SRPBCC family protein [Pirellulaceae bacterium]
MVAKNNANEIRFTRVYNAPQKIVWEAWTDLEHVSKWWGPRGFTITTHHKDLTPGGIWHYTMHGPDGVDYPNKTLYHEVVPFKKLVYDHGGYDDRPPLFRVTVLFSESDGKTTMDMTMAFPSAEEAERIGQFIKEASGYSTWDRLAEYLDETQNGNCCFVINRSFNVPCEIAFDAWTDPEQLSQWLPPLGFNMSILSGTIAVGERCQFLMSNDSDVSMQGIFEFQAIDRPRLIQYRQWFCDEQGNPQSHPTSPEFPQELNTSVQFASEGPDSTRITVTMRPATEVQTQGVAAFIDERTGMTGGWTQSFDKLESLFGNRLSTP